MGALGAILRAPLKLVGGVLEVTGGAIKKVLGMGTSAAAKKQAAVQAAESAVNATSRAVELKAFKGEKLRVLSETLSSRAANKSLLNPTRYTDTLRAEFATARSGWANDSVMRAGPKLTQAQTSLATMKANVGKVGVTISNKAIGLMAIGGAVAAGPMLKNTDLATSGIGLGPKTEDVAQVEAIPDTAADAGSPIAGAFLDRKQIQDAQSLNEKLRLGKKDERKMPRESGSVRFGAIAPLAGMADLKAAAPKRGPTLDELLKDYAENHDKLTKTDPNDTLRVGEFTKARKELFEQIATITIPTKGKPADIEVVQYIDGKKSELGKEAIETLSDSLKEYEKTLLEENGAPAAMGAPTMMNANPFMLPTSPSLYQKNQPANVTKTPDVLRMSN